MRPNDYDAHLGLALAIRGPITGAEGDYDAKIAAVQAELDAAKKIDPNRPDAYYNEGIFTQEFKAKSGGAKEKTIATLEEAKKIRRGIDHALLAVIKPELDVEKAPRLGAPEDLRDPPTQMIDGVLIAVAGLPEFLVRRLDAAFDDFVKTGGLTGSP